MGLQRLLVTPRSAYLLVFSLIVFMVVTSSWILSAPPHHDGGSGRTKGYKERAKSMFHESFMTSSRTEGKKGDDAVVGATGNSTLGFGEIFYVSMDFRTDRQDAMNLMASYTNLSLTLAPGVDGSKMSEKARPDNSPVTGATLGCWRAHADVWRRVLDSGHETALILEDDIDWDKNIHSIMASLSSTMRNSPLRQAPLTPHEKASAPYGLDWDTLWVGQCLHNPNKERLDLFHRYEDLHAPLREQMLDHDRSGIKSNFHFNLPADPRYRFLLPVYDPVCTMGYAITRRGAQKLLYHIGYSGLPMPVDNAMSVKCKDGSLNGYVVVPPIFTAWRVDGGKDSDINAHQSQQESVGKGNEGGYSKNIRDSTRKAMAEDWKGNHWEELGSKEVIEHVYEDGEWVD